MIEIIWLLLTIVAAIGIVSPIYGVVGSPFIAYTAILIIIFFLFFKWIMFFRHSPLIGPLWAKAVLFFTNIFLFMGLVILLQDFSDRLGSGFMEEFADANINELEHGVGTFTYNYFTKIFRFFLVSDLILLVICEFAVLRYMYLNFYKRFNRKAAGKTR